MHSVFAAGNNSGGHPGPKMAAIFSVHEFSNAPNIANRSVAVNIAYVIHRAMDLHIYSGV